MQRVRGVAIGKTCVGPSDSLGDVLDALGLLATSDGFATDWGSLIAQVLRCGVLVFALDRLIEGGADLGLDDVGLAVARVRTFLVFGHVKGVVDSALDGFGNNTPDAVGVVLVRNIIELDDSGDDVLVHACMKPGASVLLDVLVEKGYPR